MVDGRPIELYVLVIAHPDDESMFFVPWLMHLAQRKEQAQQSSGNDIEGILTQPVLWCVCLTTGDYDGLGSTRCVELQTVVTTVFPMIDKVLVVDEPALIPDHPTQAWDIGTASRLLQQTLKKAMYDEFSASYPTTPSTAAPAIDSTTTSRTSRPRAVHMHLVTFDECGVSGHVNHRDTYFAVRHLFLQLPLAATAESFKPPQLKLDSASTVSSSSLHTDHVYCQTVSLWTLESIHNPIAKYIPVGEWIRFLFYWLWTCLRSLFRSGTTPRNGTACTQASDVSTTCRLSRPWINWRAMATHQSQFVWYRRLFVVFSCYTYWNKMRIQCRRCYPDGNTRQQPVQRTTENIPYRSLELPYKHSF